MQRDRMPCCAFEQPLNIVVALHLCAADGEDAVARVHVQSRLSQRCFLLRIPTATGKNLRHAVVAIFDGVVRTQQPAWNSLRLRNRSASAAQMPYGKAAKHLLEDI